MVRIFIKGGVWKNTEDEILKAAVMKYGKQQWARVASLLNRKSAKQCKARWFEWLDPSVKKVEWGREEEEKLLHLAKLMPAQWRTIAPIVGRTAAQCQEKYEALLDAAGDVASSSSSSSAAGADASSSSSSSSASEARQLRAGDIDSQPETKPARPDPIDMDEDEIEMLQEARARLANTQGKKAKRKEREKVMAEAKRLADIQKKRELKAAGILSKDAKTAVRGKKRKEMDYGVEIPFHKMAPAGFHDVSAEDQRAAEIKEQMIKDIDFGNINEANKRSRDKERGEQRKKDEQRAKAMEKSDMQAVVAEVSKNNDPLAFRARGLLSMPAPSLSDSDLEATARIERGMLLAMSPPPPRGGGAGASVTDALVGEYADRPLPTPMRTPGGAGTAGGPSHYDIILQEARNVKGLNHMQTPLLGGENPVLEGGTGFEGAMPSSRSARMLAAVEGATPAPLGGMMNETPASRRDHFGLNATPAPGGGAADRDFSDTASYSSFASSVRQSAKEEKRLAKRARLELGRALANLPAPLYEYDLAAPEEPQNNDDDEMHVDARAPRGGEDKAESDARLEEIRRLEEEIEILSRSSVVRREGALPRPRGPLISEAAVLAGGAAALGAEEKLVREEMLILLRYDAWKYPVATAASSEQQKKKKKVDGKDSSSSSGAVAPAVRLESFSLSQLEEARAALTAEGQKLALEDAAKLGVDVDEVYRRCVDATLKEAEGMVWLGEEKGGWVVSKGKGDLIESLRAEHERVNAEADAHAKRTEKLAAKLKIQFGGYEKKAASMREELKTAIQDIHNAEIEIAVYGRLRASEFRAIPKRIGSLQAEIKALEARQDEHQNEYARLCELRQQLSAAA